MISSKKMITFVSRKKDCYASKDTSLDTANTGLDTANTGLDTANTGLDTANMPLYTTNFGKKTVTVTAVTM